MADDRWQMAGLRVSLGFDRNLKCLFTVASAFNTEQLARLGHRPSGIRHRLSNFLPLPLYGKRSVNKLGEEIKGTAENLWPVPEKGG